VKKIKFSRHAKQRAKLYKKKEEESIKIYYDREVDALYIKLSNLKPNGVIEIEERVNLDTTEEGKIVGIEILDVSKN